MQHTKRSWAELSQNLVVLAGFSEDALPAAQHPDIVPCTSAPHGSCAPPLRTAKDHRHGLEQQEHKNRPAKLPLPPSPRVEHHLSAQPASLELGSQFNLLRPSLRRETARR